MTTVNCNTIDLSALDTVTGGQAQFSLCRMVGNQTLNSMTFGNDEQAKLARAVLNEQPSCIPAEQPGDHEALMKRLGQIPPGGR